MRLILLLVVTIWACSLQAGSGVSGGGQVVMDGQTGEWLFVDILSDAELNARAAHLLPADQLAGEIGGVQVCTDEVFRKLGPYERLLNDAIPPWVRVYGHGEKFDDAQALAHAMLEEASKAFELERVLNIANPKVLGLSRPVSVNQTFFSTLFALPQFRDASRVDPRFQIQAAYHESGVTYFQHNVLERLTPQHRAGVFIKETLRYLNWWHNLGLSSPEIEAATYAVYHDQKNRLLQSAFGRSFLDQLRASYNEPNFDFGNTRGLALGFRMITVPSFLSHVEANLSVLDSHPSTHGDVSNLMFALEKPPAGKKWEIASGQLVDAAQCAEIADTN